MSKTVSKSAPLSTPKPKITTAEAERPIARSAPISIPSKYYAFSEEEEGSFDDSNSYFVGSYEGYLKSLQSQRIWNTLSKRALQKIDVTDEDTDTTYDVDTSDEYVSITGDIED